MRLLRSAAGNLGLQRYRMSDDEIMACVRKAVEFGYGTVVLKRAKTRR